MLNQLILNGIITGGIYALIAIIFTSISLGVQELMNFKIGVR